MILLRLTAEASASNAAIQKVIYGSDTATIVFSNEDLNDIVNLVKPPEESDLLIKVGSETVENKAKEQKD